MRTFVKEHKGALIVIVLAFLLIILGGVAWSITEHVSVGKGIYWALTTATTTGYGDLTPHHTISYWIAGVVMLMVIPLYAAIISLFTAGIIAKRTTKHMEPHNKILHEKLDESIKLHKHMIKHHPNIPNEIE